LTGQAAQVDFGKRPDRQDIFVDIVRKTWIFVMTLSFSQLAYAEIVLKNFVNMEKSTQFKELPAA
jgi:hypothetical protein